MAEIAIYTMEEANKALDEVMEHEAIKLFEADRLARKVKQEKLMEEAKELAKGKDVVIGQSLKQNIANDLHHTRFVPLTLAQVLVYSGQARIATKRELRESLRA